MQVGATTAREENRQGNYFAHSANPGKNRPDLALSPSDARAWQLPISTPSPKSGQMSHYFALGAQTDRLVPGACGARFNPGFALLPADGVRRCSRCERRMYGEAGVVAARGAVNA